MNVFQNNIFYRILFSRNNQYTFYCFNNNNNNDINTNNKTSITISLFKNVFN